MRRRDTILLTPGPLTTSRSVREALLEDWGSRDSDFRALTAEVRERLWALSELGGEFACVPLAGSGTSALEATIGSLLGPASRTLVLSNGAYGQRLLDLCAALKRQADVLRFPETEVPDLAEVSRRLTDSRFTHLAMVHCETSSGLLNPAAEVAALAERHGCKVIVDAMSTFGAITTPVGAGVGAIVASANKCLEGVPGVAFVLARRDELASGRGSSPSVTLDLHAQYAEFVASGEWRFTPPTHVVAALRRALVELEAEGGVEARGMRYAANQALLVERLSTAGLHPVLPRAAMSPIIVSFAQPSEDWFDFGLFYEQAKSRGFILYPGKLSGLRTFRVGCIGRVDAATMDRAATVICEVMALMKARARRELDPRDAAGSARS